VVWIAQETEKPADEKKHQIKHTSVIAYVVLLLVVIIVEAFASINIHLLTRVEHGAVVLRDVFSSIAVFVAAFTIISNIVFVTGKADGDDPEFIFNFRTWHLLTISFIAVAGDILAIFIAHKTGFAYIAFFTVLIALNVLAVGLAIHSVEKALKREL